MKNIYFNNNIGLGLLTILIIILYILIRIKCKKLLHYTNYTSNKLIPYTLFKTGPFVIVPPEINELLKIIVKC